MDPLTWEHNVTPIGLDIRLVVTVDGFLVSGNVEVTGIAVLDEKFAHSDHNPVKMTFKLK